MTNNNTNKEKKGMKGIFIPIEIFENADLNLAEKLLYGMIWYYSTYGSGCRISADNLGRKLDASERTIKRYRQHLKELNLVRSEGYGEKTVYYVNDTKVDPKVDPNIDNDNEEVTSSECTKVDPKSDTKLDNDTHSDTGDTPLRVTGDTNLRVTGDTHNKELNKEENNLTKTLPTKRTSHQVEEVKEKKVTDFEKMLSGMRWADFEKEWKSFISTGNPNTETYETFMRLLPSKTQFPDTTVPSWERQYKTMSKSKKPECPPQIKVPQEVLDLVRGLVEKGYGHVQVYSSLSAKSSYCKYLPYIDCIIRSVGGEPYPKDDNYYDLPF